VLRSHVRKLDRFTEGSRMGVDISEHRYDTKILELAIPGGGSTAQHGVIDSVIDYASEKGIRVDVRIIE
jgi:ribosomal protein L18